MDRVVRFRAISTPRYDVIMSDSADNEETK